MNPRIVDLYPRLPHTQRGLSLAQHILWMSDAQWIASNHWRRQNRNYHLLCKKYRRSSAGWDTNVVEVPTSVPLTSLVTVDNMRRIWSLSQSERDTACGCRLRLCSALPPPCITWYNKVLQTARMLMLWALLQPLQNCSSSTTSNSQRSSLYSYYCCLPLGFSLTDYFSKVNPGYAWS